MKRFLFFLLLFLLFIPSINSGIVFSLSNKKSESIVLKHREKTFEISLDKFNTSSTIHTVIWQASKFSRKAKNENKAKTIMSFFQATGDIENSFEIVFPGIKTEVNKIEKKVNSQSRNARLTKEKSFSIIKEQNGFALDRKKLYFDLLSKLSANGKLELEIPTIKIEAKFKEGDFKNSTNLRSSFKTNYAQSSPERKNNVQKAMNSFNGLNIYPGESISFNKTTGPRTAKNGYMEAKIILGGEYTPGFGGGVCQASTTIYNACIRAGLDCVARCHSLPPSYVEKGLDAMVNTGSSDMIITNNLNHPVYIETYFTNENVFCNVYGEALDGISYRTKVVVNETFKDKGYKKIIDTKKEFTEKVLYSDESFIKQKATQGFKTTTYLQTFKNGKLIEEKKLRNDYYPASEGIIIFGSEARPLDEIFFFDELII